VRQVWPFEVRASAPAGSDSNCMVVAAGAPLSKFIQLGMLEQAARLKPHAAMTTIRFMVKPHSAARRPRYSIPGAVALRLRNRPCPRGVSLRRDIRQA
jgi:hypothetical protein